MVARALPTVVKIEVETPRHRHNGRRLPDDHSLGSGVILDQRGYILTNRHVVHRAQRIEVTLSGDDRTYFAKLTGEEVAEKATEPKSVTLPPTGGNK